MFSILKHRFHQQALYRVYKNESKKYVFVNFMLYSLFNLRKQYYADISHSGENSTAFQFVIQPFHMYEYCHGVVSFLKISTLSHVFFIFLINQFLFLFIQL